MVAEQQETAQKRQLHMLEITYNAMMATSLRPFSMPSQLQMVRAPAYSVVRLQDQFLVLPLLLCV